MRPKMMAAILLLALSANNAAAQVGFEGIVKDITNVSFFFTCWNARGQLQKQGACPSERNGYGVEVSYDVGKISLWGDTVRTPGKWRPTSRADKCKDKDCETTITSTYVDSSKSVRYYFGLELGLSYSQFSGFSSSDPSYRVAGSVRETPGVTLYFSLEAASDSVDHKAPPVLARILQVFNPYFGVRSGLLTMSGVQAMDSVSKDSLVVYSTSGSTFQLGVVGGLSVSRPDGRVSVFAEFDHTLRRFENPQWGGSSGVAVIRPKIARPLDFTGGSISLGVEVKIGKPHE